MKGNLLKKGEFSLELILNRLQTIPNTEAHINLNNQILAKASRVTHYNVFLITYMAEEKARDYIYQTLGRPDHENGEVITYAYSIEDEMWSEEVPDENTKILINKDEYLFEIQMLDCSLKTFLDTYL